MSAAGRLHRPPAAPPVYLELRIVEVAGAVVIRLDAAAEPDACRRIAELADAEAYDRQPMTVKAAWASFGGVIDEAAWKPISLRRTRHTTHTAGAVGWQWTRTPGDGRGGFYIMRTEERGLDAPYAVVGEVVEGLELVRALPITSTAHIRGRPLIEPVRIGIMRRRLDVAAA